MDGKKDCYSATIAGFSVEKEKHDEKKNQNRIKDIFRQNSKILKARGK